MIRPVLTAAVAAIFLLPAVAAAQQDHAGHSEHAGKEARGIKTLSEGEVAALLGGEGAGYALAAELNRYPGPRHVLDLGDALSLTPSQVAAIAEIFDAMNARARALGQRLVHAERELDRAFRDRSVSRPTLKAATESIGQVEAELRYVHLEAHLKTAALLTPDQIARYDRERGYVGTPPRPTQEVGPPPSVELPPELDRVLRDYERAWRERDAAGLAALFGPEGIVMPPGRPPVRGTRAIEAYYTGRGGPLSLRAFAYGMDGSVAFILGGYGPAPGAPDSGKFTLTLRRAEDGRWLIASDMDNGNR